MKLKLSDITQIAEIVAAVAVVVSLLYVGRQVQDNTAAVKSATSQAVADSSDSALLQMISDPAIVELRFKGDRSYSELTDLEKSRYIQLSRAGLIRMQNVYIQYQLGVLDDRAWETYERVICTGRAEPGQMETWPIHASVLSSEFVEFVDNCPELSGRSVN